MSEIKTSEIIVTVVHVGGYCHSECPLLVDGDTRPDACKLFGSPGPMGRRPNRCIDAESTAVQTD